MNTNTEEKVETPVHELILYTNRKFRSKREKRYLTLDQIAVFIKAGDTVKITLHGTGEDVTRQYLSGIFRHLDLNEEAMHAIIRRFPIKAGVVEQRAEQEAKLDRKKVK